MYYVYILESSKTTKYYTGIISDNLKRRIKEHNSYVASM
ncbi:MAG: GIY-YIG nuclease family protein [Patescibacteria group bacterium]